MIEIIKLLNIYLNHFPKHEKYALSNQIRNTEYELYSLIIEGQKRYYKKTTLTNLDIVHEKLRMLIYLAYQLDYFSFKDSKKHLKQKNLATKRYGIISVKITEIGKMIGGWIKKLKLENQWK
jgi:four helix bundle protein